MHRRLFHLFAAGLVAGLALTGLAPRGLAQDFITVQSTTSTENSGLFGHLLPVFTARTGIEVHVVAVGTGQAINNAANGDGDVLFVHSRPDEEAFVAAGHGVARYDVMYNDYVILGPVADPAGVAGSADGVAALAAIAAADATFVSRGDDSGTHKAELRLWAEAGIDPAAAVPAWYREAGAGMGATVNIAVELGAYALADRASWAAFANVGALQVAVEGDPRLFNQYGVILVNPELHPNVKADLGQQFVDWLLSADGQDTIAAFRIGGQQMFFPNASPAE